mmetsp:Transcript_45732/g.83769  ORF Transcript_45732/g.83769 Transcript_45732/m.83769 type:complete len:174 (+) Transcript_45732:122-643(+)
MANLQVALSTFGLPDGVAKYSREVQASDGTCLPLKPPVQRQRQHQSANPPAAQPVPKMDARRSGKLHLDAVMMVLRDHPGKHRNSSRMYKMLKGTNAVMLLGMPKPYTNEDLKAELNYRGFAGRYDYVHIPWDDRSLGNKGFGFVNFVSAEDTYQLAELWERCQERRRGRWSR